MGMVYEMMLKLNNQAIGENDVECGVGAGYGVRFGNTTVIIVINNSVCILQRQVRIHVCRRCQR